MGHKFYSNTHFYTHTPYLCMHTLEFSHLCTNTHAATLTHSQLLSLGALYMCLHTLALSPKFIHSALTPYGEDTLALTLRTHLYEDTRSYL